ncbi:MAG: hypothetical protein NVS2B6_12330 [Thermoleophilaceae bacterium]
MRLARAALDAALLTDGVASAHPGFGRAHLTSEGSQRLEGVLVSARADDRYDVALALVAYPVPLHDLADRIRAAIARSARASGLEGALGEISVAFEDVRSREAS